MGIFQSTLEEETQRATKHKRLPAPQYSRVLNHIPENATPQVLLEILQPCLKSVQALCKHKSSDARIGQRLSIVPMSKNDKSGLEAIRKVIEQIESIETILQFNYQQWGNINRKLGGGTAAKKVMSAPEVDRMKRTVHEHITQKTVHETGEYLKGVIKGNTMMRRRLETDTRQILLDETTELLRPLRGRKDVDQALIETLVDRNAALTDRLAAEMNAKISADESALENISIANRPMKVAEEYTLLTSNAWLDAKDELDETYGADREANKIQALSRILHECEQHAWLAYDEFESSLNQTLKNPFQKKSHGSIESGQQLSVTQSQQHPHLSEKLASIPIAVTNSACDFLKATADNTDISRLYEGVVQSIGDHDDTGRMKKALTKPAMQEYVSQCTRFAWKLKIQRPQMTLKSDLVGQKWPGEGQLSLAWGSEPNGKSAVIRYYKYPSLLHGEQVMIKGSVFVN